MRTLALGVALVVAAVLHAPTARADMYIGNYDIQWQRPWDFHTYVLEFTRCFEPSGRDAIPGCLKVSMNPRPIAKATQWRSEARMVNGQYTLSVDNPFGYWCGGYYGPVVPTRDVYTWDEKTLTGTMASSFAVGPCGEPGGTLLYPFRLVRL